MTRDAPPGCGARVGGTAAGPGEGVVPRTSRGGDGAAGGAPGDAGAARGRPAGSGRDPFASLPASVTFTCDLEPGLTDPDGRRHEAVARDLLDRLDAWGARGTFFVLGDLAAREPGLVREIAARGHEVAAHGWRHVPLAALGPDGLREEARRARAALEDAAGAPVSGFRAPYFSLTPATPWAAAAILAAGYAYSSSVLPARGFGQGWPGAPRRPFLWSCGLVELPVPVASLFGMPVPALGGTTLRWLPGFDLRRILPRLEGPLAWTYLHPYDVDEGEPPGRAPGAGRLATFFLRRRRGAMRRRLAAIHAGRVSVPLAERLGEARAVAEVWTPG